ncbi:hypothetical protein H4R19_003549, partial [Coemansia spiralis]
CVVAKRDLCLATKLRDSAKAWAEEGARSRGTAARFLMGAYALHMDRSNDDDENSALKEEIAGLAPLAIDGTIRGDECAAAIIAAVQQAADAALADLSPHATELAYQMPADGSGRGSAGAGSPKSLRSLVLLFSADMLRQHPQGVPRGCPAP